MKRLFKKRPPRIYLHKKERGVIMGGFFYPIQASFGDKEFVKEMNRGYENESESEEEDNQDEEYLDQEDANYELDESPLSHRGLYDDEINFMAKKLKLFKHGYLGTFPIDKIHLISDLIKPGIKQFGFIFNTDKADEPGKHWIAVAYIAKNKELDYYNSLAEEPTDEFLKEIQPVINKLGLPYMLKFKINYIPRQGASYNCGYHALLFLYRLLKLKEAYKFASGFSEIRNGERDISKFKKELNKFGYI